MQCKLDQALKLKLVIVHKLYTIYKEDYRLIVIVYIL